MRCPYCNSDQIKVQGKRKDQWKPENVDVRYRKCIKCGRNFKTTEYYSAETMREVEEWNRKCINSI